MGVRTLRVWSGLRAVQHSTWSGLDSLVWTAAVAVLIWTVASHRGRHRRGGIRSHRPTGAGVIGG